MSDAAGNEKILDRIVKLLNLAANNPNAEEAASAAAKAQEIMTQHNLDMGSIERKSGTSDEKREKEAVEGGFYKYNRDLYSAVAKLNFCMHWLTKERINSALPPKNSGDRRRWKAAGSPNEWKILRPVHKLLGRRVNVAATKVMASYLEGAVERVLRDEMDTYNYDGKMLYSRWAMSFREGAVANIIGRIEEERERAEKERELKAKEEKTRAAHPSAAPSTSTALTLVDYTESEAAANYDARYGEGAHARSLAYRAKLETRWAEEDEAEECLKIFHPDEYAKVEEANAKYWEREDRKERKARKDKDWSAFRAGEKAGANISLNKQVDFEKRKLLK